MIGDQQAPLTCLCGSTFRGSSGTASTGRVRKDELSNCKSVSCMASKGLFKILRRNFTVLFSKVSRCSPTCASEQYNFSALNICSETRFGQLRESRQAAPNPVWSRCVKCCRAATVGLSVFWQLSYIYLQYDKQNGRQVW